MEAPLRLEALYRTVGPGLLGYLRRWCRDAQAAEDLFHETFLQAARHPARVAAAASPRAWLFAVARNVAAAAARRRRATLPLPEDVMAPPAANDDPRLEAARRALADLPPAQREPLELRLRAGLTYEEIAHVLAIPVGTVRSRLHYALEQLRETLRRAAEETA
jgi:RNA polymerase sigma-70 factor (ECF subfamily)